jgi:hypothetical protein
MSGLKWERARRRDLVRSFPPVKGNRPRKLPKPTQKQLKYLKALASKAGTTFAMPKSRWEASLEIERLKALPKKFAK